MTAWAPARAAGLGALLLLAGCVPAAAPTPSRTPSAPEGLDSGHVLVMVEDVSGWPSSEGQYDPRRVTLYADGLLIARVPAPDVMLPLAGTTLGPDAIDKAWAMVLGAGLAVDRRLELPGLFDAGSTVIRTDDGLRTTTLSIYALGASDGGDARFPPDEAALRRNAASVIGALAEMAGVQPYTPPSLLLWWAPYEDAPGGAVAPRVPWTPAVDLATAGEPTGLPATPVWRRCALLAGTGAADVAGFARGVPGDAVVEDAGLSYGFTVRPIYPDELGSIACPAS